MPNISDTDLAYLAGLLDGEGNISISDSFYKTQSQGKMPKLDLAIRITNTNINVLRWILSLGFGGFIVKNGIKTGNQRPCFSYGIANNACVPFLEAILPFLRIKKEKAEFALVFQKRKQAQRRLWNRYDPIPHFELRIRRILKHLVLSAENEINLNQAENESLPYLAGFFDGEGCISIVKLKGRNSGQIAPRYSLRLHAVQNSRDMLTRFVDKFGGYIFRHEKGKECWRWVICDVKAANFLRATLPYLRIKREQALVAIGFVEHKAETGLKIREFDAHNSILPIRESFRKRLMELKRT